MDVMPNAGSSSARAEVSSRRDKELLEPYRISIIIEKKFGVKLPGLLADVRSSRGGFERKIP
jgi:hypothetical protein